MALIRTSCDDCGDVDVTSGQVRVRVCSDTNTGSYLFSCPHCHAHIAKPATPNIVEMLTASGCRLTVWHWPAELAEVHEGPPIGWNDLIDLHYALEEAS